MDAHDLVLDAGNDAPISDAVFPHAFQFAGASSTELAWIRRAWQALIEKIQDAALYRTIEAARPLSTFQPEPLQVERQLHDPTVLFG